MGFGTWGSPGPDRGGCSSERSLTSEHLLAVGEAARGARSTHRRLRAPARRPGHRGSPLHDFAHRTDFSGASSSGSSASAGGCSGRVAPALLAAEKVASGALAFGLGATNCHSPERVAETLEKGCRVSRGVDGFGRRRARHGERASARALPTVARSGRSGTRRTPGGPKPMGETSVRHWQRWRDTTDSSTEQGLGAGCVTSHRRARPRSRFGGFAVAWFGRRPASAGRHLRGSSSDGSLWGRARSKGAPPPRWLDLSAHVAASAAVPTGRLCACCVVCFGTRRTSRSATWRAVSGSPRASAGSAARPASRRAATARRQRPQ
jgi:hypothetical protein